MAGSQSTFFDGHGATARQALSRAYMYVTLAWIVAIAFMVVGWQIGIADTLVENPIWLLVIFGASMVLMVGVGLLGQRLPVGILRADFIGFATLEGLIFSTLLLEFSVQLVAEALFATLALTVAITIVALNTRVDLTRFDSFFFVLLLLTFVALVAEYAIASSGFVFGVSLFVTVVFAGLIAWDTHFILKMADEAVATGEADSVATRCDRWRDSFVCGYRRPVPPDSLAALSGHWRR